jgi:hypothetical protein
MKTYSNNREVDRIAKNLVVRGWSVRTGKHVVLTHPDGVGIVTMGRTPSCHRCVKNIERDIRNVERLAEERKANEQRV